MGWMVDFISSRHFHLQELLRLVTIIPVVVWLWEFFCNVSSIWEICCGCMLLLTPSTLCNGLEGYSYEDRLRILGLTVLNCSRRGIVWMWGSSSLQAGFVMSGTGWGMELSLQGLWMFSRWGLITTWGTWGEIYKHLLFPLPMAIHDGNLHGWILVNPGVFSIRVKTPYSS